jgi:hypothetical protein
MRRVTHPSSVQAEGLRERVPKRVVAHVRREHKNLAAPGKVPVLLRNRMGSVSIEDEPVHISRPLKVAGGAPRRSSSRRSKKKEK